MPTAAAPAAAHPVEDRPITQELLEQYWAETMTRLEADHPKVVASIRDRKLRLTEPDIFVVEVPNSFITAEVKPHIMTLLTLLRQRSGRPNLNCKFEIVYEQHEAMVYSARDKYDVMSQANPMLATLKVILPEVDL